MDSSYATIPHPQFFQVFLPLHCSLSLRVPDEFRVRIAINIPEKVVIKNQMGKLWAVKMEETDDGLYFKEGWSRFVDENVLKVGEFMVFNYNGHHLFYVHIFGANGCERKTTEDKEIARETDQNNHFAVNSKECKWKPKKRQEQEKIDTAGSAPEENENPSFVATIQLWKHDNLLIPQSLIENYSLKFGKKIIVEDQRFGKRKWRREILIGRKGHVLISNGWELVSQCKIRENDTIICEFLIGEGEICKTMKVFCFRGT